MVYLFLADRRCKNKQDKYESPEEREREREGASASASVFPWDYIRVGLGKTRGFLK